MAYGPHRSPPSRAALHRAAAKMMKYSGARVSSRASAMMSNPFAYESQLVDTDAGWEFKQNPAGRTISARREGTCPISGDKIHPGDSITKTDEGWALTAHVHGAAENPRTFAGGMSRSQKNIRTAKKISRHEDVFEGIGLADVMSRARPGSRSAREAQAELAGANRRKRRAFGRSRENPAKEMQVQAIAQEILHEWPTINPNAEPALFFMLHPNYITGGDTIDHVVGSFLANATTWRGESARRIKAQLNALLR